MNIEQLKVLSNAEINKLCAVKVMNYGYRGYCEEIPDHPYVSPDPNGKLVLYTSEGYGNWNPTEDMNDSMILISALREQQWILHSLKTAWVSCEQRFNGFHCTLLHLDTGSSREWIADTACLAITCAALQSF